MTTQMRFLLLNPVRTDKAGDFEEFVRDVIGPAVEGQRPDTTQLVRLWKATEAEAGGSNITVFAFVAETGDAEDLDLLPLFISHYGEDEAHRLLERFDGFFADHEAWMSSWAAAEPGEEGSAQYGWRMQEIPIYSESASG